jgi:hypothetical protein
MALPLASDLTLLFSTDEFAVEATYRRKLGLDQAIITGIFDNETVPVDAGGIALVHQEQPRFMCRSADVPCIAEDDYLIISSVNYRVVAWISDGTGVTTIHLEKQ